MLLRKQVSRACASYHTPHHTCNTIIIIIRTTTTTTTLLATNTLFFLPHHPVIPTMIAVYIDTLTLTPCPPIAIPILLDLACHSF